jgi:hypothetical protein
MTLVALKEFDRATSNNILAATALSTSTDTGLGEPDFVRRYEPQIQAVLSEIRKRLRLGDGELSVDKQAAISEFLSREIRNTAFPSAKAAEAALARAAHAGLVSPTLYRVVQPKEFLRTFRPLGVREQHVENAIHKPDEVQHLLTQDALELERDVMSLFMKAVRPEKEDGHWLLVQTVRKGMDQVAQAAWRIYPSDFDDLEHAEQPIDVLEAFARRFGVELMVGTQTGKFIAVEAFRKGSGVSVGEVTIPNPPRGVQYFASYSQRVTTKPDILNVGVAYCINVNEYKENLKAHGVRL